jgi:hypothetical protein
MARAETRGTPSTPRTPSRRFEVHGCRHIVELNVEPEYAEIEQVTDDAEAEFFTVYSRTADGLLTAIDDFATRAEAEAEMSALLAALVSRR